ncbi:hypothetical protein BDR05DRAFT_1001572 [Suillus weaverae]|nr:hypothetical protein BDR05DRAFT_1001572 [Suillus weaverae]
MMASEVANSALNATLVDVQAQIKHCMKLREDDPAALTLSDEITRWVVKDLKEYGGSATSFSPLLLSVAAIVRQCAKGSVFESLPDWSTAADNDPRIISYPQFHKTVNYHPPLTSASSSSSSAATTTAITTCSVDEQIMAPPLTGATSTILSAPPATSTTTITAVPHSTSGISDVPDIPDVMDVADSAIPANKPTDEGLQIKMPAPPAPSAPSIAHMKRKVEDNDVEVMEAMLDARSLKPVRMRKRKFLSDEEAHTATGTIHVKQQKAVLVKAVKAIALAMESLEDTADSRGFWDAATRLAGWGLDDDAIATPAQHSICYHAWRCDKCIKLNKACIVLLDKKVGFTRLACGNCDIMKITCAIDGVGVQERLLAKALAAGEDNHTKPPPKQTRTRGPKLITVWKSTARLAPPKPATRASSHVKRMVVVSDSLNDFQAGQGVMDSASDGMVAQGSNTMQAVAAFQLPTPTPAQGQYDNPLSRSARVAPSIELDLPGNQLTTCDIYDSIHDLGRRFDLLATNERVDELDSRLGMVEDRFDWRLTALEAWITASDANWRGTLSSIAHLTLALQAHTGDPNAHQPIIANAMHQPPHPVIPTWRLGDVASSSRHAASTAGQPFMHSRNASLPMGVGNGARALTVLVPPAEFADTVELHDH